MVPACGRGGGSGADGTVNVFAASSLTDAFAKMAEDFEAANPSLQVVLNFGASSALVQQIAAGAAADVLVTADEQNMDEAVDTGLVVRPVRRIARNRLAILVERGNPKGITAIEDLADPDTVVVLCAPEVPCGQLAAAVLRRARVTVRPASLEENVKAVAARVTLGEADAGIVYATDVKAAGEAAEGVRIDIAADPDLHAAYPIAITRNAADGKAAAGFVTFVLSDEGRDTLLSHGFLPP